MDRVVQFLLGVALIIFIGAWIVTGLKPLQTTEVEVLLKDGRTVTCIMTDGFPTAMSCDWGTAK